MSSGSWYTSKLYDKIIKMPSKSHETIPLKMFSLCDLKENFAKRNVAKFRTFEQCRNVKTDERHFGSRNFLPIDIYIKLFNKSQ
jgi:hypothetical protein